MPSLRYMFFALILAIGLAAPGPEVASQPPSEEAVPARPLPPESRSDPDTFRDWHWRMMQDGWHGGFGYGHWGFSLLVWGLIIAALVFAVSAARSSGGGRERGKTARELLDERYARGEIDRDEYRRRLEDLGSR